MLSENRYWRFRGLLAAALLVVPAAAGGETLRGMLEIPDPGNGLRLVLPGGGSVALVADEGLELALRDTRLAGRTWEVRGPRGDDGSVRVEKIFTVKDGVLHRVTYYCEICHITTHEPGRCMCCQGDTDLRELPGE